jgi:hypothetical protein
MMMRMLNSVFCKAQVVFLQCITISFSLCLSCNCVLVQFLPNVVRLLAIYCTAGASYTSSPATTLKRTVSTGSIKSDADSASTVIANVTRSANLTPPQLFEVGKYQGAFNALFFLWM